MTPPSRLGLSLDGGHELCDLALVSGSLFVGREYLGKQFRERWDELVAHPSDLPPWNVGDESARVV
jgi:hypothetical protein